MQAPDVLTVSITVYSERGARSFNDGGPGVLRVEPSQQALENMEPAQRALLLHTLKRLHEMWSRDLEPIQDEEPIAKEA